MNIAEAKITSITIDSTLQSRADGLDSEIVQEYAQAMLEGAIFPAVKVVYDGAVNWLYDGFHRYAATREAGYDNIDVHVIPGTKRDAWKLSLGVNNTHGRNRTTADKQNAVERALDDAELGEMSARDIARICNVSHTMVSLRQHAREREAGNVATKTPHPERESSVGTTKKKDALPPVERDERDPKTGEMQFHDADGNEFATREQMLEAQNATLQQENQRLENAAAVATLPAEDRQSAAERIAELEDRVKVLEAENAALKASRDTETRRATEAIRQVTMMQKRLDKAGVDMKPAAKKAAPAAKKAEGPSLVSPQKRKK